MTAVPRDPNFWRRFSRAIHQEEEGHVLPTMASLTGTTLNRTDSWLHREKKKNTRHRLILCFGILLVVVIMVLIVVTFRWAVRYRDGEEINWPGR